MKRRTVFTGILLLVLIAATALFIKVKNDSRVDLILINGKIWTGDDDPKFVEAIAIKGNKIAQTGTTEFIKNLASGNTKIIDLQGRLASPGFNDAHSHFLDGGLAMNGVDLSNSNSLEEAIAEVERFAKSHPDKQWIVGTGWSYHIFEGNLPNTNALQKLDSIVPDRPVFLEAFDSHTIWANTRAMEIAGINASSSFGGFGQIVKDANGNPTGAFTEGATHLIGKHVPQPTDEEKLQAIRDAMQYAASLGLTSIQNASGSIDEFR
ncbi:MAG TPA: amidohydrolase family protein, partial [Flavihumibacter sp.]